MKNKKGIISKELSGDEPNINIDTQRQKGFDYTINIYINIQYSIIKKKQRNNNKSYQPQIKTAVKNMSRFKP